MTDAEFQERIRRELAWRFPIAIRTCDVCEPKADDRICSLCELHYAELVGVFRTKLSETAAVGHRVERRPIRRRFDRAKRGSVTPEQLLSLVAGQGQVEIVDDHGLPEPVVVELGRVDSHFGLVVADGAEAERAVVVHEGEHDAGGSEGIHAVDSRTEVLR